VCEASQTTIVSFEEEVRANPPDGYIPPDTGPRPYAGGRIPTVIALGVLGVGGLATGIGLGLASSSSHDDAFKAQNTGACVNKSSSTCTDLQSKVSNTNTLGTVSIVGYVAGGLFAAGAIAAFVFWPRKNTEPARGVRVRPTLGGLLIDGSF
jgi:hypothetical protein